MRVSSFRVSFKASYSLSRDTKRGFLFPQFVFDCDVATLNKGKPDFWEVKTTRAKNKLK